MFSVMSISAVAVSGVNGDFIIASNRVARAGWLNVDESTHLSGRAYTPEDLNTRVVVVHRWCIACPKIDNGVKEFQRLAKKYADTDFVFLTSYYPGAAHPRKDVIDTLKNFGVAGPVYVGAAAIGVPIAHDHRALYVVSGGTDEKWSLRVNNTDIASLDKFLKEHKDELIEESVRLASEVAPGRALMQVKKLKKSNPKLVVKLKSVIAPLDTPENRQLMDFEERVAALVAKHPVDHKAAKKLRDRIMDFSLKSSEAAKEEGLSLISVLAPLTCK